MTAGQKLKPGRYRVKVKGACAGDVFDVEMTDREAWPPGGWMEADGNPTAIIYAMRAGAAGLPLGGATYYGKPLDERGREGGGCLLHESEIGEWVGPGKYTPKTEG